jgi:hypothetical protein
MNLDKIKIDKTSCLGGRQLVLSAHHDGQTLRLAQGSCWHVDQIVGWVEQYTEIVSLVEPSGGCGGGCWVCWLLLFAGLLTSWRTQVRGAGVEVLISYTEIY